MDEQLCLILFILGLLTYAYVSYGGEFFAAPSFAHRDACIKKCTGPDGVVYQSCVGLCNDKFWHERCQELGRTAQECQIIQSGNPPCLASCLESGGKMDSCQKICPPGS